LRSPRAFPNTTDADSLVPADPAVAFLVALATFKARQEGIAVAFAWAPAIAWALAVAFAFTRPGSGLTAVKEERNNLR